MFLEIRHTRVSPLPDTCLPFHLHVCVNVHVCTLIVGKGRRANSSVSCAAVKIKKPIKTKFRMPVFNWVALKPNQINGTVFNEIDDERILEVRVFSQPFSSSSGAVSHVGGARTDFLRLPSLRT